MLLANWLADDGNVIYLLVQRCNQPHSDPAVNLPRKDSNRSHLIVITDLYLNWNLFVDSDHIPGR